MCAKNEWTVTYKSGRVQTITAEYMSGSTDQLRREGAASETAAFFNREGNSRIESVVAVVPMDGVESIIKKESN